METPGQVSRPDGGDRRLDTGRPRTPIEPHGGGDPHRHPGLELRRMAGTVLSAGYASVGLSYCLRPRLRFGGGGFDLLRVASRSHFAQLDRTDAAKLSVRAQDAAGDHPRAAPA